MSNFEIGLLIGAATFYLYDSMLLLHVNEVVFARPLSGWKVFYGSADFQLRGKFLYVPNPFTPWVAVFRAHWPGPSPDSTGNAEKMEKLVTSLAVLRVVVGLLFILFLIALPVVLAVYGSGVQLLYVFLTIYLLVGIIVIWTYSQRFHLGLSLRQWASLALECVTCPPFALNVVRKITLARSLYCDPTDLAKQLLSNISLNHFLNELNRRVDERLEILDEGNDEEEKLLAYRMAIRDLKR